MYKLLTLLCLLISFQATAQGPILSIPADETLKKCDHIFVIPNKNEKEFATFIVKKKTITAILIDVDFQVQGKIKSKIKSNFGEIIAQDFVSDFYAIYFFNSMENKVRRLSYDFQTSSTKLTVTDVPSKKQSFLKAFAYKDHFYVVNIYKNSSKLHFYIFAPDGTIAEKVVELPEYFRDFKRRASTLYDNIIIGRPVASVNSQLPTPTTISANLTKMYFNDASIIFTLDKNPFYSYIIDINLESFEGNVNVFAKRALDNPDVITRSNSFLNDGLLYSLTHNGIEMYIDIWNVASRAKVKELAFHKSEDVFLEHPVFDTGLFEEDQMKRLKTKVILSNGNSGNKGISIKKVGDNYLFILGTTYPTAIPIYSMSFGEFTAMRYSIQDFETKRELEAYLDKDFNLISTPVQPNAFDNLRSIAKAAEFKKLDTFFKLSDTYVFAYIMQKTGKINYFVSKETE